MKFILYISLCSFSTGDCLPPIKHVEIFNDWKSCAIRGLELGREALQEIEDDRVNEYKISIQYSCQSIQES